MEYEYSDYAEMMANPLGPPMEQMSMDEMNAPSGIRRLSNGDLMDSVTAHDDDDLRHAMFDEHNKTLRLAMIGLSCRLMAEW